MKTTELARQDADRLVREFGTRDPFRLAEETGVTVMYRDFEAQKGAFSVILGQPFIFLSSRLDEHDSVTVAAHELGHARLHIELAKKGIMCEYDLFNLKTSVEYEANVFAAHLLIDPNELEDCLSQGMDLYACAGTLGVNVNLLIIELAEMNRRGRRYALPYLPPNAFMGE
ncbi:MAG: ImmA/IrrE family metallo-endopeptidase [Clostridiales bacterium]|nr:ImmA/IrrE family metallo-endopeptidase [Clostridiales bacterium]